MRQERVLVVRSAYSMVFEQIHSIFRELDLDLAGKLVLLKPNLLAPSEPEQGINTHPAVMSAVISACEEWGASRVMLGDNAGQVMYGNSYQAFSGSGLEPTLGRYYTHLGLDLRPVRLEKTGLTVYVSRHLQEADIVIDLPKMKTHKLTGITGAIKNCFGYLPGSQKANIHMLTRSHERFGLALAEICAIRRPDATICDGILSMQGNGASGTDLKYTGLLIASRDVVAADCAQAKLMNMRPESIWHITAGQELGLGSMEYCCDSPVEPIAGFLPPPGFVDPALLRETVTSEGLRHDAASIIPTVDPDKCDGCGFCVGQCPVGALTMADGLPRYGGDCCGCYACSEVCPVRAWRFRTEE